VRKLWIFLLVLPALACTSEQDIAILHRQVNDVQREVQQIKAQSVDKQSLQPMETRLREQLQTANQANAELSTRISRLEEEVEALRSALEVANHRVDGLSQQVAGVHTAPPAVIPPVTAAPGTEGGAPGETAAKESQEGGAQGAASENPPAAQPAALPDNPDQLYRSAYQDYMRGNYQLAIQGFSEYIKRYPKTNLTDNAQYWIGECYDALGQEDEALKAFSTVLDRYPTSDKGAAAQLKKGYVYLKKGDQGQGVVNLQYVVYEHPGTPEADLAREKLRSLGITIR